MRKTLSNNKGSYVVFGLCTLLTASLFVNSLFPDQIVLTYSFDKKVVVFNLVASVCLIFYCIFLFRNKIHLRKNHIILIVLTVYIVINFTIKNGTFDNYLLSTVATGIIFILLGNISIKLNPDDDFLLTVFTIIVIISSLINVYAVLQLFGVIQKSTINISGTFHNSGIFAIYTSIIWSMSFGFYMVAQSTHLKDRIIQYICGANILLGIIVLPSTHSRSSWVGLILVVFLYYLLRSNKLNSYLFAKKLIVIPIITLLLLISVSAMYFFKKDSADGRMIIWKTGLIAVQEVPLTGLGFGQIKNKFMDYQENYFSKNSEDAFLFSDKVNYAFNDLLQILIENGVVGLLLFIVFLFTSLSDVKIQYFQNPLNFAAISGILSLIAASLFSYPMEIVSIYFLMFFLLLIISKNKKTSFTINPLFSKITYTLIILGSVYIFEQQISVLRSRKEVEHAQFAIANEDYLFAKMSYKKALNLIPNEVNILPGYGLSMLKLKEYNQSIDVLMKANSHLSDTYISCNLGLAYSAIGDYSKSQFYLKKAISQMPNRMYSKYLLANMYKNSKDYENAKKLAYEIIVMPVKIESAATIDMRAQMKDLVNTIN